MATLLRKLRKSNMDKAYGSNPQHTSDNSPPSPFKEDKRPLLRRDRAVEDKQAEKRIRSGRRGRHQGILVTLRKRVAGKAPSLTSNSKRQQKDSETIGLRSPRAHTLFAFERDLEAYNREHGCESLVQLPTALSTTDSIPAHIARRTSTNSLTTALTANSGQYWGLNSHSQVEDRIDIHHSILPRHRTRRTIHLEGYIVSDGPAAWIKMASEQAAPPVSYERLRQVTTEACDKTLATIKAYSHANTEAWNTQIINAILATLVQESTASSTNGATPQPTFKFVVNSTIIQHAHGASGAGDDAVKSAGRRGMHSASGAYWNNEKDGMWSFKYEAAEAKGLDVVVGIIWIWVG